MASHIRGFFEKFFSLDKERSFVKKSFIESVRVSCGIELAETQIMIKENKAIVSGTPALKNELFINKGKILKEFNKRAPGRLTIIQ
ncbi:MAG: hypothetical protein AAB471_01655 [Patescibacteria group bacterium]